METSKVTGPFSMVPRLSSSHGRDGTSTCTRMLSGARDTIVSR